MVLSEEFSPRWRRPQHIRREQINGRRCVPGIRGRIRYSRDCQPPQRDLGRGTVRQDRSRLGHVVGRGLLVRTAVEIYRVGRQTSARHIYSWKTCAGLWIWRSARSAACEAACSMPEVALRTRFPFLRPRSFSKKNLAVRWRSLAKRGTIARQIPWSILRTTEKGGDGVLGWKPKVNLAAGLESILAWIGGERGGVERAVSSGELKGRANCL